MEILEELLKQGANINVQNKNGQTPLHCFITVLDRSQANKLKLKMSRKSELHLMTLLKAPDINLFIRCDGGSTALEMAIQHRMIHVARMIAIKALPKSKIISPISKKGLIIFVSL